MSTASCHRRAHLAYCDQVSREIDRFVAVARTLDAGARVPSCPDWTAADLVQHIGTVHRWVHGNVSALSSTRIPSSEMDLEEPDDFTGRPAWLEAGKDKLLEALHAADPDAPMWAWGDDQHVRFWSRRMVHETTVHRVDAELTAGAEPSIDNEVAIDGVDEFLDNLPKAAYFAPRVNELRGDGEQLTFRCSDADVSWRIRLSPDVFAWEHTDRDAKAGVEGTAADLYLLAWGRRDPADESRFKVRGDRALIEFWRERSAI